MGWLEWEWTKRGTVFYVYKQRWMLKIAKGVQRNLFYFLDDFPYILITLFQCAAKEIHFSIKTFLVHIRFCIILHWLIINNNKHFFNNIISGVSAKIK